MCADTPDYKDTLFLPKTDFPMRAGLPNREPGWLERWETIGVYDRLREKEGRPSFVLHDGPPYANGHLHIGHGLNKVLKDMVVRSQQMMGKDSRYVPGWDCHGLPIEWKIEEQYRAKGKNKDDVPVVELRQECRKFAEGWIDIQREEFKRLGVTGNWDDPYLTMDFHAEAVIAGEFMKFLMNGSLYQGSKPVMWSVVEKTALAEAEVEYHDHKSHTIWVKFPVTHVDLTVPPLDEPTEFEGFGQDLLAEQLEAAKVVIWTTTPWTIPQNRAICFGPDISYGLYEVTGRPEECWARIGETYILADSLADETLRAARLEPTMYRRLRDVSAAELSRLTCAHPFRGADDADGEWDFDVPMFPGDHVTDEAGTGFVHTAPSPRRRRLQHRGQTRAADDLQRAGGRVLPRRPALLRRPADLRPQGQGREGECRRYRQTGGNRRPDRARANDPLLPALLAIQGTADLPQHAAMVRRHRPRNRRRQHVWQDDPRTRTAVD